MAEAPSVKIKKEDASPMEMLWKYFDSSAQLRFIIVYFR